MKLSYLFFFISIIQVTASTYSQEATLNLQLNDVPLKEAFNEIHAQSGYGMFYSNEQLNDNTIISIHVEKASIHDVMLQLLHPFDLEHEVVGKYVLIKPGKKQVFTVQGRVTDEGGLPLIGVNIQSKKHLVGTATDEGGYYALSLPDGAKRDTLIFTYIGYETKYEPINGNREINVELKEFGHLLEGVVVVGYGTVQKRDLTGSVSSIEGKELGLVRTESFDNALAGRASGVFVSQTSGAPGAGATINIRGLSSIKGDNQPLYVIDGVPTVVNAATSDLSIGTFISKENPLLAINPNDIESIEILKDASAAAIYGARAANGVIIVTTKKGKRGQKAKIDFNYSYSSFSPINKYDVLDAAGYKSFATDIAQKQIDNLLAQGIPEDFIPFYVPDAYSIVNTPDLYFGNADTDWQDEITNQDAGSHEYGISVRGGTEKSAYSISLTGADQEGLIKNSGLKRYGIRASQDTDLGKRLRVGNLISYNYTETKTTAVSYDGVTSFRPDLPVYNEDGSFSGIPFFGGFERKNPVSEIQNPSIGTSHNLLANLYAELEIIENLKFRSQINVGRYANKTSLFNPDYSIGAVIDALNGNGIVQASLNHSGYTTLTKAFDNTLTYNFELGANHSFNAMAGFSWNSSVLDLSQVSYAGFPDNEILVNPGSASEVTGFDSDIIESGLNSYFGRVNYSYADKYLLTVTARRDGSSKFGPNNKWGFFPSAAVAWKLHNESFLSGIDQLDILKLRASVGRTGLDNLQDFDYLAYYQSEFFSSYADLNGIVVTGIPNPDIRWETTDQLDVGLEFSLFENRLNAEVIYFTKMTNGILLYAPIPYETGFRAQFQNRADMSNKGWEIELGGDIVRTKDFRWNSSFNISFIKNKIENLNNANPFNGFSHPGVVEGHPLGTSIGFRVDHIISSQEEIEALNAASPTGFYQSPGTGVGDYLFKDLNGDGQITRDGDREVIGSVNPDYFGGWSNTFSYKGLQLDVFFQFVQGVTKFSQIASSIVYDDAANNKLSLAVDDRWSEDNPDSQWSAIGGVSDNAFNYSDRHIVDASYIRLKGLRLSYQLPSSLLSRWSISGSRIYVAANNLWTLTDYPGLDPESVNRARNGSTLDLARDTGNYPFAKTIVFGVNLSL